MSRKRIKAKFSSLEKNRLIIIIYIVLAAAFIGYALQLAVNLPDISTLAEYIPPETTVLYDLHNKEFARLHHEENRRIVPLSKISPKLRKAILIMEDRDFYSHHGILLSGMIRASLANFTSGKYAQGASSITQQLARTLFLTHKKTITRKLSEIILALEIERYYTKDEILEMYLNHIYWGHNTYGAESASMLYFGKPASDLTLAEAALLAGLVRGPELYSPYKHPERANQRKNMVLDLLLESGEINGTEATLAKMEPLTFETKRLMMYGNTGHYFTSYILKYLLKKYGAEKVYNGGLKVYTTMDSSMQYLAERIVSQFVSQEGQRYRFSQAALVAIDPRTGYIRALVGGADFWNSKFNRAIQGYRQPGSSFKTFVYTAAMEEHISPGFIIEDSEIKFYVPKTEFNKTGKWEPRNFDNKFRGNVTVREALEKSYNIPSIKLLEKIGIDSAIDVAKRMGIKSKLARNLALTLGVSEVSLLEMTSAYGVLANNGIRTEPISIIKVVDKKGAILEQATPREEKVLEPETAAIMVDMMRGVLARGTGVRGRINRPAAAKTGTTQDFKDAWFIGFVPQLVCGVWVGNDNNASMQGVAEVSVCPRIWKKFMDESLQEIPIVNFQKPKGLTRATICLDSGKLATSRCPQKRRRTDLFWDEKVPFGSCNYHQAPSPFEFFEFWGETEEGTDEH